MQYEGYARLKVTSPDETLDAAVRIAEAVKGYVESRSGTTLVLRVPVASIQATFLQVLALGDVLARALNAQDVTEAFLAAELRLTTLRASRDRLVELLATANASEKVSLLREIQRLSEQIVSLEVQVRTMQQLAVFSRITLDVVPRQLRTTTPVDELAAFNWIHQLSPFNRNVAKSGDTLELDAPTGLVVLENDDDLWAAESADGAVLWTSKRDNEPHGDTAFWLGALRARLGKEYASVEETHIGRFTFLRMSDDTYSYMVGVMADDDDLQLVEIYYPTAEHEKRHAPAIAVSIERGET